MFNIYYINYEKAYQIAMLIDNKIIETKQKEKEGKFNTTGNGNSSLGSFDEIPFIGKYMPKIEIKGEMAGSKSHKVIDTVKVISTKSTILRTIYSKAKEIKKLNDKTIGSLVRMKDISLNITNEDEVLGIKTMISGAIGKVPVEGMGDIDITALLSVMLKDAAYILEGELPEEKFGKKQRLVIKIPMQTGNELENQYSLSDLEIGKVTLMGIYRGAFEKIDLMRKLNRFSGNTQVQDKKDYSTIIENDSGGAFSESTDKNDGLDYIYHYLDVIAVVQDISF